VEREVSWMPHAPVGAKKEIKKRSSLPLNDLPPTSLIFESPYLLLPFVFLPLLSLSLHTPSPNIVQHKGEAIPVTGRAGPQGCETSRLPHVLPNRLTDDGEVVSLTRRPPFTLQEDSWYSFLLEAESTPGPYCGWKD
jgi:hypothetical protein